jgi:hypothetical protein
MVYPLLHLNFNAWFIFKIKNLWALMEQDKKPYTRVFEKIVIRREFDCHFKV